MENKIFYYARVSSKEQNVRDLVQNLNKAFNGKGGGRDTYAQGKVTTTKDSIIKFIDSIDFKGWYYVWFN